MSKQKKQDEQALCNESRRNLLKGFATAAVAGAVITGTAHAATNDAVEAPLDEKKKTGYRETQHIKDYYDTL
ncbi:transcriptional initiation protein Tat [Vibrio sp. 10N.286.49.C2]|uniref:twin-arginine translocation signal domain-containing protein n=1 Tax=unclassified Vibrio TaxID=2614977 RepID=UPI000C837229|nr:MULTISPECIES: twin-arginine translocation signal domain-containing protein [unclassified Vibrio]PMH40046.1 transcriptional initiation protein Tat [Vibrio sp. 10N.286.49.C2]PMH52180.1 transcriptional initiation protein Tat [Vibrio sp. 10N.286.49.B1]PMH79244.1 transcriptional initiation protein Tat [Vibrio sp. 10N.286.48.B7]